MLTTILLSLSLLHDPALETDADWGKAPIGATHGGVAVLSDGRVLVNTDSDKGTVVFNSDGTPAGAIAANYPAIHGMEVRTEPEGDRIYAAHLRGKQVLKLRPDGSLVWAIGVPMESAKYANPNQYNPTAVTVAPDGRVYVADGYGQNWVHIFGPDLRYRSSFGGHGTGDGQFRTCHGILMDERTTPATVLVCDRENGRIQRFDLDGNFIEVHAKGLHRPCAAAISPADGMLAVAELNGRVTLLEADGSVRQVLGLNPDAGQHANYGVGTDAWKPGVHTAPHGICWDARGNLYVQDWNAHGRISRWAAVEHDH